MNVRMYLGMFWQILISELSCFAFVAALNLLVFAFARKDFGYTMRIDVRDLEQLR
jgi:hypothetical protein